MAEKKKEAKTLKVDVLKPFGKLKAGDKVEILEHQYDHLAEKGFVSQTGSGKKAKGGEE